jgi:hypothetical protein
MSVCRQIYQLTYLSTHFNSSRQLVPATHPVNSTSFLTLLLPTTATGPEGCHLLLHVTRLRRRRPLALVAGPYTRYVYSLTSA